MLVALSIAVGFVSRVALFLFARTCKLHSLCSKNGHGQHPRRGSPRKSHAVFAVKLLFPVCLRRFFLVTLQAMTVLNVKRWLPSVCRCRHVLVQKMEMASIYGTVPYVVLPR